MSRYFTGIGGQHCGTSWLGRYLAAHPQVMFSPIKELHLFDCDHLPEDTVDGEERMARIVRRYERPDLPERWRVLRDAALDALRMHTLKDRGQRHGAYAEYFARRVEPRHRAFGEITPAYSLLPPEGFRDILRLYPDAKFIFLMRDPVDRFWSALRHRKTRKPEFDPVARFEAYLDKPQHFERSNYVRTLMVLRECVAEENVLTLFYEDLFSDASDRALLRITDFLGIDHRPASLEKLINAGHPLALPVEKAMIAATRMAEVYDFVADEFPRLPKRWLERMALIDRAVR